jgi:hypothetical protein
MGERAGRRQRPADRVSAELDPQWERELREAGIDGWASGGEAPRRAHAPARKGFVNQSMEDGPVRAAVARGPSGEPKPPEPDPQPSPASLHRVKDDEAAGEVARAVHRAGAMEMEHARRAAADRDAHRRNVTREAATSNRLALAVLSEQADIELELQRGDPVRAEAARARARVDASVAVREAMRAGRGGRSRRGGVGIESEVHRVLRELDGELSVGALDRLEQSMLAELRREEVELRESRQWWPRYTRPDGAVDAGRDSAGGADGTHEVEHAATVLQSMLRARRSRM